MKPNPQFRALAALLWLLALGVTPALHSHPEPILAPFGLSWGLAPDDLEEIFRRSKIPIAAKSAKSAEPPESIMPFSMTSAQSSGGVWCMTSLMRATIPSSSSEMASVTSSEVTVITFGKPETMSRPFTSMLNLFSM